MLTTIRAFALERLAAHGETASAYAALIAWCMVLADPGQAVFYESLSAAALDRLETELANLRAAFTWLDETGDAATALQLAVALGSFWHVRGQIGEGRDRIERALAACPTAPAELRARALYWMGSSRCTESTIRAGFGWLEESLALHTRNRTIGPVRWRRRSCSAGRRNTAATTSKRWSITVERWRMSRELGETRLHPLESDQPGRRRLPARRPRRFERLRRRGAGHRGGDRRAGADRLCADRDDPGRARTGECARSRRSRRPVPR